MSILIPVLSGAWGVTMITESIREYRRSARRQARAWEQRLRPAP